VGDCGTSDERVDTPFAAPSVEAILPYPLTVYPDPPSPPYPAPSHRAVSSFRSVAAFVEEDRRTLFAHRTEETGDEPWGARRAGGLRYAVARISLANDEAVDGSQCNAAREGEYGLDRHLAGALEHERRTRAGLLAGYSKHRDEEDCQPCILSRSTATNRSSGAVLTESLLRSVMFCC